MKEWTCIKTLPGGPGFELFEQLPKQLYPPNSDRYKLGNDPVLQHLEGCYILKNGDIPIGRFSFYENPDLICNGAKAACIGSYECIRDIAASQYLIQYAVDLALKKGYSWLIGPMEGSTWHNYRFSQHNDTPNFFMEPYHHVYYNEQFAHAGFTTIADYTSNLDQNLECDPQRIIEYEKDYQEQGITVRHLNSSNLKEELKKLAEFSIEHFNNNFLFTPIEPNDFVEKYAQLGHLFDPGLILIIEDTNKEIIAFVFAIKDYYDPEEETMIIKTIVRKQDAPIQEIGKYLSHKTSQMALDRGYKKIIHALMIEDNTSNRISEKLQTDNYKSYTLYGLHLQ